MVELYVGFPSQTGEPPNQLKGFAKVLLSPGETRTVTIALDRSSFSTWNSRANRWTVAPGTYDPGRHVVSRPAAVPAHHAHAKLIRRRANYAGAAEWRNGGFPSYFAKPA